MSNFRTAAVALSLMIATLLPVAGYGQSVETEKEVAKEASESAKLTTVTLAGGSIRFQQPASWTTPKTPRSRIIEREFSVPKAPGDETDGRLTMMRSGGSVKVNVERWFGQFTQPDGKSTKDVAKVITKKMNDQETTIVDISGTFSEQMGGGPFAPGKTVVRKDYRMLGGIVQTKSSGQYFFKLYGPQKTIAGAEKHFLAMLESVKSDVKRSN